MARIDVVMPQMGESIAEGTVSKWLKQLGDVVKRDEPIFEISTDKVDAEIPAPAAGTLAEIIVSAGQTVAIQTVVARIETDAAVAASTVASTPVSAPAGVASASPGGAALPASPVSQTSPAPASRPALATPTNGTSFEERIRMRSSPLVRKIAAEHGIELAGLTGTGIAGRVTKRDITAFIDSGGAVPAGAGSAPSDPGQPGLPPAEAWAGDIVEPMSKMRLLIRDHMLASRRASAHVSSFFEVDLTRVARIRAKKRVEFEAQGGGRLSFLPFIIRSVVEGLKAFPAVNAAVRGNDVIYRKQYNIGIAVALDWGLIVPVIKRADSLSLVGLTRSLNDLATRARAKRLQPDEVEDGTFTITNPGVFGSLMGTPIINQPQVAILGVGAIEKRPKVIIGADGEDTIAVRTCAYFSISFDHRLIDGAVADEFMAFVKKQLETFPEAVV
jgi:2-oxoglutarate dehydrogenase E2 component (dihydrolipoamide succinyltransferase)